MATQFPELSDTFQKFIEAQHMFFVATAAPEGQVNVSPKGMDSLRVLGPNRIIWRNATGSGNETAGHLKLANRMTLMWCSFERKPLILRCYGSARTIHPRDDDWDTLNAHFPEFVGARQIYDMQIDIVQSSCGYAVPFYDFKESRDTLIDWTENRGAEGVSDYWDTRNRETIDGLPTGILDDA